MITPYQRAVRKSFIKVNKLTTVVKTNDTFIKLPKCLKSELNRGAISHEELGRFTGPFKKKKENSEQARSKTLIFQK